MGGRPSEGEAQAAVMATEGTVDGVASQDHDSLLFGAPLLVRNITISGRRRLPSKNIFIDVEPETDQPPGDPEPPDHGAAHRPRDPRGTDFNPTGSRGSSRLRAMKFLKTYRTLRKIEPIKEELAKIDYPAIRKLFLSPPAEAGIKPVWKEFGPTLSRRSWSTSTPSRRSAWTAASKRLAGRDAHRTSRWRSGSGTCGPPRVPSPWLARSRYSHELFQVPREEESGSSSSPLHRPAADLPVVVDPDRSPPPSAEPSAPSGGCGRARWSTLPAGPSSRSSR